MHFKANVTGNDETSGKNNMYQISYSEFLELMGRHINQNHEDIFRSIVDQCYYLVTHK